MAQVPMRMAQPGLVPPHQQRTPMMVSMTQPPPVSMQGLVSMAPMMGPAGGMAVMTQAQAMSHPDSVGDHLNTPYHHPHHPHHPHAAHSHPHAPPHPHGPPRAPPPGPPPQHHPSSQTGPPPSGPQHSQYHPHHHHQGPHMSANTTGGGPHASHNGPSHIQHMNTTHHSAPSHQMNNLNGGGIGAAHHHHQQQPPPQHHPPQQQQAPHQQQHHHPSQHHSQSMHQPMSQSLQHHHQQQAPSHMQHIPQQHQQHHHQQHHHHQQPQQQHQQQHHHQQQQQQQAPPPAAIQTHQQSHHQPQNPNPPSHHQQSSQQPIHNQTLSAPPPAAPQQQQQQQHSHHHQLHESINHSNTGGNVNIASNVSNMQIIPPSNNNCNSVSANTNGNIPIPSQSTVTPTSAPPTSTCSQNGVSITTNSSRDINLPPTSENGIVLPGPILDPNDSSASKEKTPMCLVNELARFNRINHQYCLTDEKGPAHKKTFTVTLRLGDNENYSAHGASIKKAQHSAAAIALEKTKFSHPPPKPHKVKGNFKITPTVELNALAMKRGEAAVYTFMDNPRPPNPYNFNMLGNFRNIFNQKFYGRSPVYPVFVVTLRVGLKEFSGEGVTAQQAKHNAASKALKIIKALPMPDSAPASQPSESSFSPELSELDPNAELKSPISLVHEIALKRNLTVEFDVIKESGPPHMRTFVTICTVGDIRTEGDGTGKKVSKKRAAELMLEELRKLPPLPSYTVPRVKKKPATKKKSRNLIKYGQEEQKAAPEYGQGINPISRLIQIQQAKKEKEPIYTLIAERGVPRRREFIMQVVVGNETAQGTGSNKKLAKRAAAENMLQLLGYSRPQLQPGKPAIKTEGTSHTETDKTRKVTFMEDTSNESSQQTQQHISCCTSQPDCKFTVPAPGGSGRQLVPGLIMMPDGSALHGYQNVQQNSTEAMVKQKNGPAIQSNNVTSSSGIHNPTKNSPSGNIQTSQHQGIQKVDHHSQSSVQQHHQTNMSSSNAPSQPVVHPKDQLMYLAQILGLQVQFTDFPKGNKSEYLSLVSLSTSPPQVSHGAGTTIDASHDQACLNALQVLAEMGLDTVTSNGKDNHKN